MVALGVCACAGLPSVWVGIARGQQPMQGQSYTVAGRVVDKVSASPLARAVVVLEPVAEGGAGNGSESSAGFSSGRPGARHGNGRGRFGGANGAPGEGPKTGPDRDPNGRPSGGPESGTQPRSVVTGADGSFRFSGVPEGRYRLAGSRRGYLTGNLDQEGQFFAAVVTGPGHAETESIRLAISPEAEVRGRVQDSSGDPVQSANVTLFRRVFDGTGQVMAVRSTSVEAGSSRYSFSGLLPDTYYVAASGRPWWASTQPRTQAGSDASTAEANPLDVAYATQFFDGASSADQAEPITLAAGETVDANLTMQAVPAVHVQVAMQPGRPLVQLQTPAFSGAISATAGQVSFIRRDGDQPVLELSVAPGTYRMGGGAGMTVTVTAGMTLPTETEPQSAAVTGKVGMADGSALPPGVRLQLVPEDETSGAGFVRFGRGGRGFGRREVDLPVAADGTLHANAVEPGSYALRATLPNIVSTAVMGMAAQGAAVAGTELTVGSDPVMLAATLARADATVSGVLAGAGTSGAGGVMVLLVPADTAQVDLYRQDESNLDGSFSFSAVAAGQYRVVAIADGWGIAWKNPSVTVKYVRRGELCNVSGSGVLTLPRGVAVQPR
jgi:hypothetical protein